MTIGPSKLVALSALSVCVFTASSFAPVTSPKSHLPDQASPSALNFHTCQPPNNPANASCGIFDVFENRAAFLVGIATPGFKQPLPFARAAQNALDLLFEDCATDVACQKAFPNFKQEFAAVLARFDHGPVQVSMLDSAGQRPRTVNLEGESFTEHLRIMLYTTYGASVVPYVTHQAFLQNYVPFETQSIRNNIARNIARGMYFSVTCAEGVPFITEQDIARETRGTFLGDSRVRLHIAACKEWPRGDVPANFTDPLKSDIPVVMISGQVDGSTPPWIAEGAVKFLPNGRLVPIRYTGHQMDRPCVWELISTFIKTANAAALDTSCTQNIHRPPFITENPGTRNPQE